MSSQAIPHNDPQAISKLRQYFAVALATTIVAGLPVGVVWWLRVSGTVTSPLEAVALGMGFSLWLSCFCRLIWETRPGSEDLLFSELMIWGYLHRRRSQRRLANVAELLAPIGPATAGAHPQRQAKNVKLLEQLVSGLETRDPYLHGHSRRVARHSWMIARKMGLGTEEVARIRTGAAIHDVGKINTPKAILHKPGRLTDAEYEIIKRHPGEGADMAEVLDDEAIVAIVRHHHERVDGSGYPSGLVGDEIPLGARIVAVADTFDAITSARPYRAASAHSKAIDILREEAGTRLDPDVVKAFCGHYAGNRPLAAWSFLAGLPERFVTWLSSSAASVASAAKVVAVAAIVGTGAVGATVAARPAHASRHRSAPALASAASSTYIADAVPVAQAAGSSATGSASAAAHRRSARAHGRGAAPVKHASASAPAQSTVAQASTPAASTPAGVAGSTSTTAPGSSPTGPTGTPPAAPAGEEAKGEAVNPKIKSKKTEEEAAKAKAEKEAAAKKAREEAAAKAKAEKEAAAKLKREEAAAKAKAEKEAAAKLKREEAAAKAKAEKEAAAKAKAEKEAAAKAEEEAKTKAVTTAP